ncbi:MULTISPECIES: hypothetical protein [unclassified Paenibacillus]|uniref:hypothetical protein n=1 Tax=unclassified Paenibacillus TaxID=185978 RepID=UPI001C116029|nr:MULTISPECIES: hypothetical protein [unclassified Paenibacillus]MBU5442373.1 hypothetical protein [Paenibacillus sp. MSJ-34]
MDILLTVAFVIVSGISLHLIGMCNTERFRMIVIGLYTALSFLLFLFLWWSNPV